MGYRSVALVAAVAMGVPSGGRRRGAQRSRAPALRFGRRRRQPERLRGRHRPPVRHRPRAAGLHRPRGRRSPSRSRSSTSSRRRSRSRSSSTARSPCSRAWRWSRAPRCGSSAPCGRWTRRRSSASTIATGGPGLHLRPGPARGRDPVDPAGGGDRFVQRGVPFAARPGPAAGRRRDPPARRGPALGRGGHDVAPERRPGARRGAAGRSDGVCGRPRNRQRRSQRFHRQRPGALLPHRDHQRDRRAALLPARAVRAGRRVRPDRPGAEHPVQPRLRVEQCPAGREVAKGGRPFRARRAGAAAPRRVLRGTANRDPGPPSCSGDHSNRNRRRRRPASPALRTRTRTAGP